MIDGPTRPRLHPAGDSLLLVEFEARMDAEVNARVVALAGTIAAAELAGVRDVVPGYSSIGVHIDPLRLDQVALERVIGRSWDVAAGQVAGSRTVEIPVCYGGVNGPDLGEVASFAGCTEEDVIGRHAGTTYRVFMLGFLPGFAYLGAVDAVIAMPRRPAPRTAVPPGSVGIAGRQTGVYPVESPGGWRLIGRTPWRMFDQERAQPALLRAGDLVQFVPASMDQWDLLEGGPQT